MNFKLSLIVVYLFLVLNMYLSFDYNYLSKEFISNKELEK